MALYTCTKCGKKVPMQYEICPYCQTPRPKLNPQTQSASKNKQEKKKSKKPFFKRWWFWLIAVFLVIGSIGNMGKDKDDDKAGDKGAVSQSEPAQDVSKEPEISNEPDISSPEPNDNPTSSPIAEELKGTDLFEDVYVPYASRENRTVLFQGVKIFAENCGYEYEVTDGSKSDTEVTAVKIMSGDDYVYIAFCPRSSGIETIMVVSYYQASSNSEVSLSNYSTDGSFSYDKLDTHIIGESNVEVDSIDDQRKFLFANTDKETGKPVETASLDKTLPQDAATASAGGEKVETAQNPEPKKEESKSPANSNDSGLKVAGGTSSQPSAPKGGGGGNANNFNTYDNSAQQNTEDQWVLNISSMKIHYPSCREVKKIAPKNYSTSNLSESELMGQGYTTCGVCH